MASFVQGKTTKIPTALASTAPVSTPVNTMPAATISGLGTLATEGYSMYAKEKGRTDFENVLEQYDKDIQASEDYDKFKEYAASEMASLVSDNKELGNLRKELGNLKEAEYQRAVPTLLLELRGEAAMKKAIRRAPGLRREIAQIAQDTLHFDPSGATIRAIMKGLQAEGSGGAGGAGSNSQSEWYVKDVVKSYSDIFGKPMFMPDGSFDIKGMENGSHAYRTQQLSLDATKEALAAGEIQERDGVQQTVAGVEKLFATRMSPALVTAQNLLTGVKSWEEFQAVKPQLDTMFKQLKDSSQMWWAEQKRGIKVSGENAKYLDDRYTAAFENSFSGFQALLDSDNSTEFENRLKTFDLLTKQYKMDWTQANQHLASLANSMPGFMNGGYNMLLASDFQASHTLKDLLAKGFSNADPAEIKKLSMGNLVASLQSNKAFQNMSASERADVANNNAKLLNYYVKKRDPKTPMTQTEMDSLANAYATVAQTLDTRNGDDVHNTIRLLSDPRFNDLVDQMNKSGASDNLISSEIIADSNIAAMSSYMREYFTDQLVEHLPRIDSYGGSSVIYDVDTGTFMLDYGNREPNRMKPYKETFEKDFLSVGNNVVKALDRLKEHDPSIAGMSINQLSQALFLDGLRKSGVRVIGDLEDMPAPKVQEKPKELLDREKQLQDLSREVERLKLQLQGEILE